MSKGKKILGSLSPLYGAVSGEGAFGKIGRGGLLGIAKSQGKDGKGSASRDGKVGKMKKGGVVGGKKGRRGDGICQKGKTKGTMR